MQMKLYKTFKNANLYKIPVKNMKSPVAVFSSKAHFPVRGTSNTAESFIFTQPEQLKFFLQHLAIMISTTDIFWHFHIPQTPSSFVHRSCKYTSKDGLVWDHQCQCRAELLLSIFLGLINTCGNRNGSGYALAEWTDQLLHGL